MFPIFEQGTGKGIGLDLRTFISRFRAVCDEHISDGRAKAFAFIFYDFKDNELKKILKDLGVFARLDRLTGKELSLFYLHSGSQESIALFNDKFLAALGLEEKPTLPAVVFFRLKDGAIADIEVAQLDSADLIHGFSELEAAVTSYIDTSIPKGSYSGSALKWIRAGSKAVGLELLVSSLAEGLKAIFL